MKSNFSDLFICCIARELCNDDRLFIGVNQADVMLAACMARRLWAPELKVWASGQAAIGRDNDRHRVGKRSYERSLVESRSSFFWQARAFDDMKTRPRLCFAGGIQVDSRGNANLAGIGENGAWKLRGPGSAGLPSLTTWARRFYILVPDHARRSLVETCSRISVLGDPVQREAFGLPANSLAAVITPLARFVPSRKGLLLAEVSPGISVSQVSDNTGFDIEVSEELKEREPVSPEERETLRFFERPP